MPIRLPDIEYKFKKIKLLETALTHSSYSNEHGLKRSECNERMEFLGDAVLSHVTTEFLYHLYPEKPEGELTRLRSSLVCEASLADAARNISLGDCLLIGRGEVNNGGRDRPSILADAFEAIIAAIYLDGGFHCAKQFILNNLCGELKMYSFDYKTKLQEFVQRDGSASPEYNIISTRGPDHAKVFTAEVRVHGAVFGLGEGQTKKDAEQHAAQAAYDSLTA